MILRFSITPNDHDLLIQENPSFMDQISDFFLSLWEYGLDIEEIEQDAWSQFDVIESIEIHPQEKIVICVGLSSIASN